MTSGGFMDLIGIHYNKIVALFKSRSLKLDMQFDEDAFGDAFIKCAQKFGDTNITYDTAIKYFWVSYLNTVKSQFVNSLKYDIEHIDSALDVVYEESYSETIYNTIMDAITIAFSEEDMNVYRLYKYHNWSKKELTEAGFNCDNLDNRIKVIHKFVKQYAKEYKKSR